jgi:hypothetical protein
MDQDIASEEIRARIEHWWNENKRLDFKYPENRSKAFDTLSGILGHWHFTECQRQIADALNPGPVLIVCRSIKKGDQEGNF